MANSTPGLQGYQIEVKPGFGYCTYMYMYLSARKMNLHSKKRYVSSSWPSPWLNSLTAFIILFNHVCIEVNVLIFYLSFSIRGK